MTKMSDLSIDVLEEILSRVPVTSTRAVRSTCRKWNTLSKNLSFRKKHLAQVASAVRREGELQAIVLLNFSLYLMSVNLHGTHSDDFAPSIRSRGNLISLNDSDILKITRVYHCDGLVLCVTGDYTRLVLWNPYTGQTRRICAELRSAKNSGYWYNHALGYDKSTYKVLRVLDVTTDWDVEFDNFGLSLKGNTYWYATDKESREDVPGFLLCFDFTTERFGPCLPLPFESYSEDVVTLSSVRDEQLAVLYQNYDTYEMEIWVTTKIEPNAMSWSKFLAVDMNPLTGFGFYSCGSFLIDEEKRAVVVFDLSETTNCNAAYFIGVNGYFREVDLGTITTGKGMVFPHAFSYVPSSVLFESGSDEKR
ncbi:F-box domain [Arabidopsis thaliana x Arabidopsis arenosa]|uniref:F-box domain n=1 Tax=Arabidopsis thaliana x Arabidopsis arenosa TaxID=1240361 RepID=A0A8T2ATA2_9BRAS|nr:F-box domain [Arabidopsis thaliana x Arabidopsis arenosa]